MEKVEIPQIPTSPEMLFDVLAGLNIKYELHHHRPIFTVEEGADLKASIPGLHCRNLFLRDKKGTMFLVLAGNETVIDLKNLEERLGCGRLSFGSPERLMEYLGIYPGAVCPFAVINDTQRRVQIMLDGHIAKAEQICVHPLDNRMTICLKPDDLLKFLTHTGHSPVMLDF